MVRVMDRLARTASAIGGAFVGAAAVWIFVWCLEIGLALGGAPDKDLGSGFYATAVAIGGLLLMLAHLVVKAALHGIGYHLGRGWQEAQRDSEQVTSIFKGRIISVTREKGSAE